MMFDYIRDPDEIYKVSFATVRREADLGPIEADAVLLVTRLIHACAMPDIVDDLVISPGAVAAGRNALRAGAPIFVDCEMVRCGIIAARLPAANEIICTLHDNGVRDRARAEGTTRSAAALDLWGDRLEGAVVAIGNAPTALFHLLELIAGGAPAPAFVAAFPVGFVGAAESKDALIEHAHDIPFATLKGRRGGSAMAAASINALNGDALTGDTS